MPARRDDEWREFYTEVGFRHGFELGARALREAVKPYLSAEQISAINIWLETEVVEWKREYLRENESPSPPQLWVFGSRPGDGLGVLGFAPCRSIWRLHPRP